MKVLVTGGCGFLGRRIVERIAGRGDEVIALDIATDATQCDKEHAKFVAGDVTNMQQLVSVCSREAFDAIVHCAAIVGAASSVHNPIQTLEVNLNGSLNLFEIMKRFSICRMIHISTNEVYGDYLAEVIDENHPIRPLMAYGISKAAVEQFGRTFSMLYGTECINLRGSWIYGPGFPRPRLPTVLLDQLLRGEAVRLESGADSVMDYVHVDDFVDATISALYHGAHQFDVYNIGSGVGTSLSNLVGVVRQLLPNAEVSVGDGQYVFASGQKMRIQGALNIDRARRELGYRPKRPLKAGLEEYLRSCAMH